MLEEEINNPRYPHTIRILRITPNVKNVDADDDDPLTVNNPTSTYLANTDGKAYTDETGSNLLLFEDGGDENVGVVQELYNGIGRSFTDTTTNGNVEVDTNKRKASIPMRFDKWGSGKLPLDGDTIYATVGENTERGRVRDCEPDNNRTVVYWDFIRV